MRLIIAVLLAGFILSTCESETEEGACAHAPETGSIIIKLPYEPLEDSLPKITRKGDLVRFFSSYPSMRDLFFGRSSYPNDSVFINDLYGRFSNPHLDTLLSDTHVVFGNGDELRNEFGKAYVNLKYYYPDLKTPKIQTVITGLENDLYVSDSLVLVGLDYFLGNKARYKPNMYDYMLRRYTKDFIVPSVMLLTGISPSINKINPGDKTVLADMITFGKAFYFAKSMVPCTPDSVLIGYSTQEIEGSRKHENLIWSRFVEDEVLFATSHFVKQKYLAERPKTVEVGEQCPGRIGTWVGWQIVKKYMTSHPDVTLQQLMENSNAPEIFKDSGYKPQVVKVPGKEKI